jgi:5-deoxy-glucuronate isomerase
MSRPSDASFDIVLDLHRRPGRPAADGATIRVDADAASADDAAAWRWVSFSAHTLADGSSISRPGDGREVGVVVLEGEARISVGGRQLGQVGSRASVFDEIAAPVVLVEPGIGVEITAVGATAIALAAAPGGDVRETRLIDPATMRVEARGSGRTARTVRHLLPAEVQAGRLLLVEVLTPGGNWSSYPPHKHDTDDPPRECLLEELYYYRFALPHGFAFQRVYTSDGTLDEAITPMDGDVVLVPRGYHPVAAAAGYDCYYLNVMAGPVRAWRFTLDPDHAWLMHWSPDAPRG